MGICLNKTSLHHICIYYYEKLATYVQSSVFINLVRVRATANMHSENVTIESPNSTMHAKFEKKKTAFNLESKEPLLTKRSNRGHTGRIVANNVQDLSDL